MGDLACTRCGLGQGYKIFCDRCGDDLVAAHAAEIERLKERNTMLVARFANLTQRVGDVYRALALATLEGDEVHEEHTRIETTPKKTHRNSS